MTAPPASNSTPLSPSLADPDRRCCDGAVWALLGLTLLGLAARFALAKVTWGTNDADSWVQFAFYVNQKGILLEYQWNRWLNHPPLPVYWAMAAYRMTQDSPWVIEFARPPDFPFIFKIPVILADGVATWLIYQLWKPRIGPRRAMAAAAGFAWSLVAILVSGYHCNTDPIYAMFCLACAFLIEEKRMHFWGGAMLAAAINVKLTPVLLIPPLILSYRSWRDLLRFVAGLSLGVLPFVPIIWHVWPHFYANAFAYKSIPDNWGIPYLLMHLQGGPPVTIGDVTSGERPIADFYHDHGKSVVLGLIGLWSLAARLLGRWNRYELAAVALTIFLFFAPGFGVQYAALSLPLIFACHPRLAALYGLIAGLFLLVVYYAQWPGPRHAWPPNSQFRGRYPDPAPLYGLAAWALLGWFLLRTVVRRRAGGEEDRG